MTQFRSTAPTLGLLAAGFALAAGMVPGAARAELAVGSVAPDFTTPSAEDGKAGTFSLKAALKQGPVVLYFYPKAFTTGCTLEAHAFAEAMGDFHKARASVIGLSNDDLPTLQKFSTAE